MVIKNARVFLDSGEIIENGFVEFDEKIRRVGSERELSAPTDIDAMGALLLPGFIDAHSHIGMCEDSLGFEGDDLNEISEPSSPHMRAIDALNPSDPCFLQALEWGVTTVVTGPGSANPVSGQSAALKTYGDCIDEMLIKAPLAMKLALGENPKSVYHEKGKSPITRMATAAIIRESLVKAVEYSKKRAKGEGDYNAALEALVPVVRGELAVHIHAHRADDIMTAVRLAEEFSLKYVIVHATDGARVAPRLAEKEVPVLSGPFLCDRSKPELKSLTPRSPSLLCAAGVKTAIITDHPVIPQQYLSLCAALAVSEGMSRTDALLAITRIPAEICGIDNRVGSIKEGLDADLLLFDKDPLTNVAPRPARVFVSGREWTGA